MVEENGGNHLQWEEYEDAPPAPAQQEHEQTTTQRKSEKTVCEKNTMEHKKQCSVFLNKQTQSRKNVKQLYWCVFLLLLFIFFVFYVFTLLTVFLQ